MAYVYRHIRLDKNEPVGEYNGVHEAARELGVKAVRVSACVIGKRNKTGGYAFKRIAK